MAATHGRWDTLTVEDKIQKVMGMEIAETFKVTLIKDLLETVEVSDWGLYVSTYIRRHDYL